MANFTLVANGITEEQFEKALEIKNKAGQRLKFTGLRFEWSDDGVEYGAEIMKLFAPRAQSAKA